MNIIDALIGEHAALGTVFDHVQKFQAGWSLQQSKETGALLDALLATHAVLEDDLLFDPLAKTGGRFGEMLQTMREEHDQLRRLVADLKYAETEDEACRALRQIVEVGRDHFAVEERVLFGMAAELLGTARLQRLGEEWAARRHLSFAL